MESEHGSGPQHEFKLDETLPQWHGWHARRRGLATNLKQLGVDDLTIQKVMRHEDVSTTRRCYIKSVATSAQHAMEQLGEQISALGNNWATGPGVVKSDAVQ